MARGGAFYLAQDGGEAEVNKIIYHRYSKRRVNFWKTEQLSASQGGRCSTEVVNVAVSSPVKSSTVCIGKKFTLEPKQFSANYCTEKNLVVRGGPQTLGCQLTDRQSPYWLSLHKTLLSLKAESFMCPRNVCKVNCNSKEGPHMSPFQR
jgi:hypothetical protein